MYWARTGAPCIIFEYVRALRNSVFSHDVDCYVTDVDGASRETPHVHEQYQQWWYGEGNDGRQQGYV